MIASATGGLLPGTARRARKCAAFAMEAATPAATRTSLTSSAAISSSPARRPVLVADASSFDMTEAGETATEGVEDCGRRFNIESGRRHEKAYLGDCRCRLCLAYHARQNCRSDSAGENGSAATHVSPPQGSRSSWSPAKRYSTATFWPSIYPSSFSRWPNARRRTAYTSGERNEFQSLRRPHPRAEDH